MIQKITDPIAGYAPTFPLDREPTGPVASPEIRQAALVAALEGIPLGDYDRRIVDWLSGWDDGTARTVVSLVRRATAAAFVAGTIQGEADARDLEDEEAETCPEWCQHHSDDEAAGERTHFGARERVGAHEVQAVEVRRLADGQTVTARVFLGAELVSVDEARRLARLLWADAGLLAESSTEWAGEDQAESLDDDRLRISMQHGVWAGRMLANAEMDADMRDKRELVEVLCEIARRVASGQMATVERADVDEIARQARAGSPAPKD